MRVIFPDSSLPSPHSRSGSEHEPPASSRKAGGSFYSGRMDQYSAAVSAVVAVLMNPIDFGARVQEHETLLRGRVKKETPSFREKLNTHQGGLVGVLKSILRRRLMREVLQEPLPADSLQG